MSTQPNAANRDTEPKEQCSELHAAIAFPVCPECAGGIWPGGHTCGVTGRETAFLDAVKFYNGAPDYDLAKDPRCLWGWGPSPGHACFRPFGHDGMCWDGGDRPKHDGRKHQTSKRPSDWDAKGRTDLAGRTR